MCKFQVCSHQKVGNMSFVNINGALLAHRHFTGNVIQLTVYLKQTNIEEERGKVEAYNINPQT